MGPSDEEVTTTTVSRRRPPVVVAAVVALVGAALIAVLMNADEPPTTSTESTTSTTSTTSIAAVASTPAGWARFSGHAIALTEEFVDDTTIAAGPLIVIDLRSGEIVHEIDIDADATLSIAIDPAGTFAYVERTAPVLGASDDCNGVRFRIDQIPLDPDAEYEPFFFPGAAPVLSPDGSHIAYLDQSVGPDGCAVPPGPDLVVDDVATGARRAELALAPAEDRRRPWIVWLDNELVAANGHVLDVASQRSVDVALPDFGNSRPLGFDPFNEAWIIAGNATGRIDPYTGVTTWDISLPPVAAALDGTGRALLTVHRTDAGSSIDTGDTVVSVDRTITAIDW